MSKDFSYLFIELSILILCKDSESIYFFEQVLETLEASEKILSSLIYIDLTKLT